MDMSEQAELFRLLLVGGGHAHLFVLEAIIQGRLPSDGVALVSPSRWQYYSGMLPGLVAGHYRAEQCRIDLEALCEQAGIVMIIDSSCGLEADRKSLQLASGRTLGFEQLSLDIGSQTDLSWIRKPGNHLISVKPMDRFLADWQAFSDTARRRREGRMVVVGGGAAGVELAMAARTSLRKSGFSLPVTLIASNGVVADFPPAVRKRVERELERLDVRAYHGKAQAEGGRVKLDDGTELQADLIIATSGAKAPRWLAGSDLELDHAGFVRVDQYHRSCSHPDIYAVGDISARPGTPLMKSGVHSVRVGPILAHNLLAARNGDPLKVFRPRRNVLYLISCGDRRAVASWGPLYASGGWVWHWKDRIDRAFIDRFSG
ncbi:FAD-dependent oxidoreductase [Marinobacterium litorale]|uniref:FAD-dependent oxidoreductase n=1 Tax=Marinobacterium litorale TaxID=404770 RepID=UPI0004021123|nr:FAD-dependent oxidoreductase [Marinobacterium litorale]